MQAIFETVFDILYLTTVTAIGINMIKKGAISNNTYCLASWRLHLARAMPFI